MGGIPRLVVIVFLLLGLAFVTAPMASGATIYSNWGSPSAGSREVNQTTERIAVPFVPTTTGTPRVSLLYGLTYLFETTQVSISLYKNDPANGGQPGEQIAEGAPVTFDDTSDSAPSCAEFSGVFGEPVPALTAGQKYWAVYRNHTAHTVFLGTRTVAGGAPRTSSDSGATWAAATGDPLSLAIDDQLCAPDINPTPVPGVELGDMYAKPGGTGFQTLFVQNNGVAQLNLTAGSFTGPSASMFRLLNGEPNGKPPGSTFTFPKAVGTGSGGVFIYVVCAPPAGTADGQKTATFTLTSNDPDEGSISWPVWCLVDTTPPSLEFTQNPDGLAGWFHTRPAPLQVRGVDPESGNRVKRIFCSDNGEASLDWPNGSVASFAIQPDGIHALSCQGTDAADNTSAPGAYTTTVKVDATPPDTAKAAGGPPATSEETAFSFPFTGTDATAGVQGYECRLDNEDFQACTSPASRSGLANGTHTFEVRARDVAGNADPTPAQWSWQVAAPPPQVADDSLSTAAGAASDVDVLANDVEPRGGTMTVVLGSATTDKGGSVTVDGSKVHYVPPAGFAGTDTFTYRAVNATGVTSAVATVTVTVEAEASAAPFTPVGNATDSLVAFPAKATALALTPVTFRAAAGGASTAAKKKRRRPPVGTTVRYQLDKASLVTFTVEQALPGRRQGTSCVKPIKALRKAKKCTRFVVKSGAFTHNGQAGANALPFTGRLADKRLGRGRYRLVATPAPLGGTAAVAVRAPFRVVK